MLKIRLMGTTADVTQAVATLQATPGLEIIDQSRPYPCRGTSALVRVYLDARLPTTEGAR
jgi:hypothetical protein